jgi:hypothetical protein
MVSQTYQCRAELQDTHNDSSTDARQPASGFSSLAAGRAANGCSPTRACCAANSPPSVEHGSRTLRSSAFTQVDTSAIAARDGAELSVGALGACILQDHLCAVTISLPQNQCPTAVITTRICTCTNRIAGGPSTRRSYDGAGPHSTRPHLWCGCRAACTRACCCW